MIVSPADPNPPDAHQDFTWSNLGNISLDDAQLAGLITSESFHGRFLHTDVPAPLVKLCAMKQKLNADTGSVCQARA
jgi:hypothetical protein